MSIPTSAIAKDLVGELEEVMKADSPDRLQSLHLPLLHIAADVTSPSDDPGESLEGLVRAAVEKVKSRPEKEALKCLLLDTNRWRPLAARGPVAAAELGITYDALRRRNPQGVRRLDSLLTMLAGSIAELSQLDQIMGLSAPAQSPNPGQNVFQRTSVFLSYSHHDDEHEGGLISALRDALVAEFRFQTGEELFVFQDKSSIDVGEHWRRRLEQELRATSLLLVFLTPSYLKSEQCRDELRRFLEREKELGRNDLILPIYYATLPAGKEDALATTILERQFVDWRPLRFESFDAPAVRMAVAELARSIASAIARTGEHGSGEVDEVASEDLGFVERVAAMDLALPRFLRSMMALTAEQEGVNNEVTQATEEAQRLNSMGRGGAARFVVARRLSAKLEPYAERIEQIASDMQTDLESVDQGMRAMAELLPGSTEPGVEEVVSDLVQSIMNAKAASETAAESVTAMSESYVQVGRLTSTLKPVLNRLIRAVKVVQECPARFGAWIEILQRALAERSSK